MKEFACLLYRQKKIDGKIVVEEEPAVAHPYEYYSFDRDFIYATANGFMDVYQKHVSSKQKDDGIFCVPIFPLGTINYVNRYKNFFVVRIGKRWNAYSIDGLNKVVSDKNTMEEVIKFLKEDFTEK